MGKITTLSASLRKHKFWAILIITTIVLAITLWSPRQKPISEPDTGYWIWAGITARDAPPDTTLYIYQGLFTTGTDGTTDFRRNGLYPYPLESPPVYLVYRLEGQLPDPSPIVRQFEKDRANWQHHNVTIAGIQIDFDSATSKLLIYRNFLEILRQKIPSTYHLSITGLGDWAVQGNKDTIRAITEIVDDVSYQLYQDRAPVTNITFYIEALEHYPFPFRLGLLANASQNAYSDRLSNNPNFKGIIYFIQK